MKVKYGWAQGSCMERFDPDAFGETCRELRDTVGLTPRTLLDASRDESAPTHGMFEWDDAKAAEGYRLGQAGHAIRSIRVVREGAGEPASVRAFVPVTLPNSESRGYEPVEVVMRDEAMRRELLGQARRDMQAFEDKYHDLDELAGVIGAMDAAMLGAAGGGDGDGH